jgi:hypothetical protein
MLLVVRADAAVIRASVENTGVVAKHLLGPLEEDLPA